MNREFKFRVWNIEDKEWVNPAILEVFNKDGLLRPLYTPFDNYIIQQFTGLLDSNKKEIFEGDIVRIKDYDDSDWTGVVEFGTYDDNEGCHTNKHSGWFINLSTQHKNGNHYEDKSTLIDVHEKIEIVGNVYENKELL